MDDDITTFITILSTTRYSGILIYPRGPGPWITFFGGIDLSNDLFQPAHWNVIEKSRREGFNIMLSFHKEILIKKIKGGEKECYRR